MYDITIKGISFFILEGSSWSWSYGSWIYNYLCNQHLSPLMLWVRILFMTLVIITIHGSFLIHDFCMCAVCGAGTAILPEHPCSPQFFLILVGFLLSNFMSSHFLCCVLYPCKNDVRFVLTSICFVESSCFSFVYLYLFTYAGVQYDFHIRWYSCRLTITRWVSLWNRNC